MWLTDKWFWIWEGMFAIIPFIMVIFALMNAPQVNSEIESGNCSVSIPADMIHNYLPNLDLEKLKQ